MANNTKDNTIDRTINTPHNSSIRIELVDPNIPDVEVEITGRYYQDVDLRHAAKEFTKLADDLVDFKENVGHREKAALEEFTASRYNATMSVQFHKDGDVSLNINDQRFHSSGIQELIDHLKKVQEVLRKSQ